MRNVCLACVAMLALLFVACDEGGVNDGRTQFELKSQSLIRVGADASEAEVSYSITNPIEGATVTASADVDWISDFNYEASSVSFSIGANDTGSDRSGKVTLSYDAYTITVGVLQSVLSGGESNEPYVRITSRSTMSFTAVGGDGSIDYAVYNTEEELLPDVTVDVDWITNIEVEADAITFHVAASRDAEERTGTITVALNSSRAKVTVVQEAASKELVLTVEDNLVRVGAEISITAIYAGEDVTAETKIYDYYTAEEVSNPATFSQTGERVFYGMYNGNRSKVLTINVIPANAPEFPEDSNVNSFDFNYRMLIVDHTGATCGYCPNMKIALRDLSENPEYNSGINIVYAYSFSTSELCYSADASLVNSYYKEVCKSSNMPLTGYPSATCNYLHTHAASPSTLVSQVDLLWREVADAGIAVASNMEGNNITVAAEIKSSVAQYYRIAVWVLEDDIYERQSSGQEWMHTHHDVLRDCLTDVSKSDIAGLEWGYVRANESSRKVFEFTVDDNPHWVSENYKLAVVISAPNNDKGGKYEVVNTVICNVGESVGFEYN